MANKKSIAELLAEAKQLRLAIAKQKQEMKEKKSALAVEYADNLPEAEKQKQITEAEKILLTAKQKAELLRAEFKKQLKVIKEEVSFAKEILEFVNYKNKNSLPKTKNSFRIEKNIFTFNREGIKEITIDVSKSNWEKIFKEELKKQGINGENRIADNIVYKAQQLLKSNVAI